MNKQKMKQMFAVPAALCACAAFCFWQNNDLTVSRYIYATEKTGGGLDGFKIIQISDLHNKEFGKNQRRLLDVVKTERPDIIVITGDIVDGYKTKLEPALELVRGAVKIAPVYYVTGNHESLITDVERKTLTEGMLQAGAEILCNEFTVIEYGGASFYLLGLDDANAGDGTLENMTAALPDKEKLKVLLAHKPQYMDNYASCGADLIFSGHVHGGQIRLPLIGGLLAPEHYFFPEYDTGMYTKGNTVLMVSRGLGNSVLPLRVFDRPDIVTLTFREKKS